MKEFKAGDKVIRINGSFGDLVNGAEYTVDKYSFGIIRLEGHHGAYRESNFKLVESKLTPHVHQKEIIAWANGATIQYWAVISETWNDTPFHNTPSWVLKSKYRVKPDKSDEIEAEVAKLYEEIDKNRKAINDLEGRIVKLYSSGE